MPWIRRTSLLAATAAIVVLAACAPIKGGGGAAQSNWMAGSGNSTHQNLDAILQDPAWGGFNGLGENIIHGGCGISARQMHQAWMGSPLHRANILGNFSVVGIGVACNGGTSTPPRTSGADLGRNPLAPRART
jgi:hypothetical protein